MEKDKENKKDEISETNESEILEEISEENMSDTNIQNEEENAEPLEEDVKETEEEKFKELVEDVEYTDEHSFRNKLNTLKESYFPKTGGEESFIIDDENSETAQDIDTTDTIRSYMSAISRTKSA